nr:DUF624 domain-containing protein [Gracilibacillus alcaliphilus]
MVYINLLTIFFTILGVGLFGFFPALIACFSIIRKDMLYDQNLSITKTFFQEFKKYFIKGNLAGWIFFVIGCLLYVNFTIAKVIGNEFIQLSYYPILLVFILFLMIAIHIVPLSLHYHNNWKATVKNAWLILFVQPVHTIFLIGALAAGYYLIAFIPGLIPFFGVSGFVWIIMFFSLNKFKKIDVANASAAKTIATTSSYRI